VQDLRPEDMAKGIDGHPFPDYLNGAWDKDGGEGWSDRRVG